LAAPHQHHRTRVLVGELLESIPAELPGKFGVRLFRQRNLQALWPNNRLGPGEAFGLGSSPVESFFAELSRVQLLARNEDRAEQHFHVAATSLEEPGLCDEFEGGLLAFPLFKSPNLPHRPSTPGVVEGAPGSRFIASNHRSSPPA
jgi:hypothetical protein